MESNRVNKDSIDDIKPPIPPNFLSVIRILIVLIGTIIWLVILYVPGMYSFWGLVAVPFITVMLMIITMLLSTVNDNKHARRSTEHMASKYQDSQATQQLVSADYDTLEALGLEQLDQQEEETGRQE